MNSKKNENINLLVVELVTRVIHATIGIPTRMYLHYTLHYTYISYYVHVQYLTTLVEVGIFTSIA